MATDESFWGSGVKKNGQDRHWSGSGNVLIEASAVPEYLAWVAAPAVDASRSQITTTIAPTDVQRISRMANSRSVDPEPPAHSTS